MSNIKKILLISPGHRISTIDVYYGAGDALKILGYEVNAFDVNKRLTFYEKAITNLQNKNEQIAWEQIYSVACQGIITSAVQFWPDLILYITGQYIPTWIPASIKDRLKIKQAIWFTESPYQIAYEIQRAPLYDYVFTCDKSCEAIYKRFNPNTYYLPTAYNDEYKWVTEFKRWEKIIYNEDLFFIGSEVPGRLDFLKELASLIQGKVDFKLFGVFPSIEKGGAPELEQFYIPMTLKKYEVIKHIQGAKITLNHFRINESKRIITNRKTGKHKVTEVPAYSLSPRIYEVFASHGFLLSGYRPEFDDLDLKDGRDLAIYKNAKDCADKIFYYLAHNDERDKIRLSGAEKMKNQTYEERIKKMMGIITKF